MTKSTAILVRLSPHLKQNIIRVAKENRRSISEQVRIALENNIAAHQARSS